MSKLSKIIISFLITLSLYCFSINYNLYFKNLLLVYVLFFLLIYKLIGFDSLKKVIKTNSKSDIIFVVIFLLLLFVPMSNISQAEKSINENRFLSKYKPFISEDFSINYNYGKNFSNWFNDRFYLRNELLKLSKNKILTTTSSRIGIIDKQNNFLYHDAEFKKYSDETIEKAFENLVEFEKFLNKHNTTLYVLLVPKKIFVYPSTVRKIQFDYVEKIEEMKKKTNLKIIYPLEEIKKEKDNDYMYFRTDHHWTDSGAFVGYKSLMNEIKKDYPQVSILSQDDYEYFYRKDVRGDFNRNWFYEGHTCRYMNLSKKMCNEFLINDYKYYKHQNFEKMQVKITDVPFYRGKDFYFPNGTDLRVILFGTSMCENLTEFLPFSFKHTRRIRNNDVKKLADKEEFKIIKYFNTKILEYKPDIFVMCITFDNLIEIPMIFEE